MTPQPPSRLSRWLPAMAAMLFLFVSLDLYQRVEQGDLLPGPAAPAEQPAPRGEVHNLTAEMLLPDGGVLAIDRVGDTLSLVVLEPDGRSSRVIYRGAPGEGLLGGVYDRGRRYNLQGVDGIFHVDRQEGLVGWTTLPEGQSLEDLEAGLAVTRMDRPDGTSHFYVYRGQELRHEFHLSSPALAARLSPDGETMGLLLPGRVRLVPLTTTEMPIDLPLDAAVRADLIVSDSGRHAMVVREDGNGVGLVSPSGVHWFDLSLRWANQPLEAGLAELDPTSGRFAVTDGRRILVGSEGGDFREAATVNTAADGLHLGEWTPDRGLLFTVMRGGVAAGYEDTDGFYFLDPEDGSFRSFAVTEAYLPGLGAPALCGASR